MSWAQNAAKMDAIVDEKLGDDVEWSSDGIQFTPAKAFVVPQVEVLGLEAIDSPLGSRYRLKIAKSIIPEILDNYRFRASKLGAGMFKNASDTPDEDDRYWIFDLQKAR